MRGPVRSDEGLSRARVAWMLKAAAAAASAAAAVTVVTGSVRAEAR